MTDGTVEHKSYSYSSAISFDDILLLKSIKKHIAHCDCCKNLLLEEIKIKND